jgi:hypothetical protein
MRTAGQPERSLHNMKKIIDTLFTISMACVLCSCSTKNSIPKSAIDRETTGDHVVSAILMSGDMCFKMPVLEASYSEISEEQLRRLIEEEEWVFAKLHFIHFYLTHVEPEDKAYVNSLIEYVKTDPEAKAAYDGLGNVEGIIEFWETYEAEQKKKEERERYVPYDESISDAEALDVAEATFHYQFQNNASADQQGAKIYFLSLFKKDPSAEFLKRFERHMPPIKNGSEFEIGEGLLFNVSHIKRLSKTQVEVWGGYYEAGLSSSGCTYILELKDGKWIEITRKLNWIS